MADNITSFIASYDSSTNSYSFSKLNRLVSYIFSELRNEEKQDEDWNKILLVPVTTELDSEENVVSISHDMEVNSARLVRGTEEDPQKSAHDAILISPEKSGRIRLTARNDGGLKRPEKDRNTGPCREEKRGGNPPRKGAILRLQPE